MPFDLESQDVMHYLWGTLEKTPDGKHIRYTIFDIDLLWKMGFVDTKAVSFERWRHAFEPFKQADGSYIINEEGFLSLDQYRYKGVIHVPFDAMLINEGYYTEEGLNDLIEASIAPSCDYSAEKLKAFFDGLKKEFRREDGLVKIGKDAKVKIKVLIDKYPSPLRNLEMLFERMLARGKDREMLKKIEGSEAEKATARAVIEASVFSAAPVSRTEVMAGGLKKLEKAKKRAGAAFESGKPEVPLKKVKRSRKGMRG